MRFYMISIPNHCQTRKPPLNGLFDALLNASERPTKGHNEVKSGKAVKMLAIRPTGDSQALIALGC